MNSNIEYSNTYFDFSKNDQNVLESSVDFTLITDEILEFNLRKSKKYICVNALISTGRIVLTDGYFLRNEIHRFRMVGSKYEDINKSYYDKRKELFAKGLLVEETVLKNKNLSKFTNDNSSYTRFRIVEPIEFESIVFATSMILGNWLSLKQCFDYWTRNTLKLEKYIIQK
ncbi:MAG TPA: hypothetical protein VHO03_08095 [Ignavibacteriales bacterium]|nr:hypothetical protein [Ignavibacteriales bacterium]